MRVFAFILVLLSPAAALAFPNSLNSGLALTTSTPSFGLALTSNYLIYSGNGIVGVIPLSTGVEQVLSGFSTPQGLAAKSDDSNVYVAEYGTAQVRSVKISPLSFATPTMTVGTNPWGLALSETTLWVTNMGNNNVMARDTASGGGLATVTVGNSPKGIATKGGGARIYVADTGGTVITPSSLGTGQISPVRIFVDVALSGDRAYFVENNGTIEVVNTLNDTLMGLPVAVGGTPQNIAVHSSGGYDYIYISDELANKVTILEYPVSGCSSAVRRILQTISVTAPQDIVIASDGSRAYVASSTTSPKAISVLEQRNPVLSVSQNYVCINNSTRPSAAVTLRSDSGGDYRIEVNGTAITGCGTYFTSGSIASNSDLQVTIKATDLSASLTNTQYTLYAFVTAADGRTGNAGFGITLDTVPPGSPSSLQARSGDEEVELSWTPPSGTDAAGYYIYFTTDTGGPQTIDAGSNTSYTVTGLQNKTLYYFTVTAYDCAGNEGQASGQVKGYPAHVPGPAERAGEKGGCFIATEVFGPMSFEVEVLRRFRETFLRPTIPGTWCISMYAKVAPSCSVYLRTHPVLRAAVRMGLVPVTFTVWLLFEGERLRFLLPGGILLAFSTLIWLRRSLYSP